jgi:hypothetical protein
MLDMGDSGRNRHARNCPRINLLSNPDGLPDQARQSQWRDAAYSSLVRPSAFAVLRLVTSSELGRCSIAEK